MRISHSKNRLFARLWLFTMGLVVLASGCQAVKPTWPTNLFNWGNSPRVQESKFAVPARMAIMWSPAMLNQAGQQATRGFGGRIYFYDAKNNPVSVEGQLVIYAYNNDNPHVDSRVPDKKFAFTPEQFTQHYTPTDLGASYSIWIPWDAIGQPQADISLVPIFTATNGALVMGQSSRNLLPGPTSQQNPANIVVNCSQPPVDIRQSAITGSPMYRDNAIQQASFQQSANGSPPSSAPTGLPQTDDRGGVSTMSITLPGTLSDRLAQSQPQISTMQKMAMLRQEALAKQAGFVPPPSLIGSRASAAGISGIGSSQNPVGNAFSGSSNIQNVAPTGLAPANATIASPPAAGAVPPPWMPGPTPQPARSELPAPPALGGLSLPQVAGPPPSRPSPGAQPSYFPPGSPQSSQSATVPEPWSGGQRR